MTLRKGEDTFELGSSGSHYVESSLWKRLWTCRKTDYYMNEMNYVVSKLELCFKYQISSHTEGVNIFSGLLALVWHLMQCVALRE
jgi:hypothetical protein